jgi:hypothetical protein
MEELFLDDFEVKDNFIKAILSNGSVVNVPKAEIEKQMKALNQTMLDTIDLWLCDNDYLTNDEQQEFIEETKGYKVDHQIGAKKRKSVKRTVKISEEKQTLFNDLSQFLAESGYNFEVLKENKLISVKINDISFKIDLIQQRKPKNS